MKKQNNKGNLRDFESVIRTLPRRRRYQFLGNLLLMLLGAAAEFITLGTVIPFVNAMLDPGKLLLQSEGTILAGVIAGMSASEMRIALTASFVALLVASGAIRVMITWASTRFSMAIGYDLSSRVYGNIVTQDYMFHLKTPSAELLSSMQKINTFSVMIVIPIMQALAAILTSVFIFAALMLVNAGLALVILLATTGLYLLINFTLQPIQRRNSFEIARGQSEKIKLVQEGFGGIRDIIVNDLKDYYVRQFATVEHNLRNRVTTTILLTNTPRYLVETVLLVATAVAVYFVSQDGKGLQEVLPTAVAFALGLQRVIPYMQLAYRGRAQIAANAGSIRDVAKFVTLETHDTSRQNNVELQFNKRIVLNNVSFRYSSEAPDVLERINFTIERGSFVGITGATGSGKSTLIDVIMGLQLPTTGCLVVDGLEVNRSNIVAWRRNIAHVSQAIFIANTSIRENIALGVDREFIDDELVVEVARIAELTSLVSGLAKGLDELTGERGARLSGGQKQRIGIARALYLRRPVLVLDEATSALDADTQTAVMKNIRSNRGDTTILSITHRLETLSGCDYIVSLEGGHSSLIANR